MKIKFLTISSSSSGLNGSYGALVNNTFESSILALFLFLTVLAVRLLDTIVFLQLLLDCGLTNPTDPSLFLNIKFNCYKIIIQCIRLKILRRNNI